MNLKSLKIALIASGALCVAVHSFGQSDFAPTTAPNEFGPPLSALGALPKRQSAISPKEASSQLSSPIVLGLNEIVRSELPDSEKEETYHFWLVDLPEGEFKGVMDMWPKGGGSAAINASLDWCASDGKPQSQLHFINFGDDSADHGYRPLRCLP